jgi:hypothetical protein
MCSDNNLFLKALKIYFLLKSATAHSRPHYRGFTITLRHTTACTTPLDEASARRRDL